MIKQGATCTGIAWLILSIIIDARFYGPPLFFLLCGRRRAQ
jgi:hypothetical protein